MAPLFRIIVPVSDIERAAHFYLALLGAEDQRVSPGRHYECEGTILACDDTQPDGDGRVAKPLPEPIYMPGVSSRRREGRGRSREDSIEMNSGARRVPDARDTGGSGATGQRL